MQFLFPLFLILCCSTNSFAQTSEDVIHCISQVFALEEVRQVATDDFYKEDDFLIYLNSGKNINRTEAENILRFLETDDFLDAPVNIRIIRDPDMENEEIQPHQIWRLQIVFQSGRILVQVNTRILEARKFWNGFFLLENQDQVWSIIEKNSYLR